MSRVPSQPDAETVPPVRRTHVKEWLTRDQMSPLGQELMDIATEIEQSDAPALDEAAIEQELRTRRGGYSKD